MSHTFPAPGMADDRDTVEVDHAVEGMSRRFIPNPKLPEMFEMNNRPGVVPKLPPLRKFTSMVTAMIPWEANNWHRYKGVEFLSGS